MDTTASFPAIPGKPAPLDYAPTVDARKLGAKHGFQRGLSGALLADGRPAIRFQIEPDAVRIEHSLFGAVMTQRLPIVPAANSASGERLSCSCGAAALVLYGRPGTGFLCSKCAKTFYATAAQAELCRLADRRDKLERRLGFAVDREGYVNYRPPNMPAETRADLNMALDYAIVELAQFVLSVLPATSGKARPDNHLITL